MSVLANVQSIFSKKYEVNTYTLIAFSVLFMITFDNHTYWSSLLSAIDVSDSGMLLFLVASFSLIFSVCFTFISILGVGKALKPLIAFMLILASFTAYYMDAYGTVFDRNMVLNIYETNTNEALELIDKNILFHIFLYGLLPVLVLYRINIKNRSFLNALSVRFFSVVIVVSIAFVTIYSSYKDFSFIYRENREISAFVNPVSPMRATYRFIAKNINKRNKKLSTVFSDAHKTKSTETNKKNILIMVVGETARAENFHLNNYKKNTTPELEKLNTINFGNVTSCGTATAISVPCMFSDLDQAHFDIADAKNRQNLLDALDIAGIQVLWRENNPGCKGVCDRIETHQDADIYIDEFCKHDKCYDEALLAGLQTYIKNLHDDAVIVLHMQGSHGPAYYKRYPEKFRKFLPECHDSAVQNCNNEEIENAYDNTIVYTDYFLSKVIQLLEKEDLNTINASMLYISDHGESLGENGVYLHGLPYYMAPDHQKHIPMIFWASKGFAVSKHLDITCLNEESNESFTHDNIIHSVLGIMDVTANLYKDELDIFSSCRHVS